LNAHSTLHIATLEALPGQIARGYVEVGETATGMVRFPLVLIHGSRPGPRVCLTAGVHATEYAPIEAAFRLMAQIDPEKLSGSVVVVPVASMHMFAHRVGFVSPLDGLNLNKVAPGGDGSISELLVRSLLDDVIVHCQYHIDLHAGDLGEMLLAFAGYPLTGDSRMDREGEALVRLFTPSLICLAEEGTTLPPFSGSIVHSATRRGVVSMLAESGGNGTLEEEDVRIHVEGVLNILRYLKMIEGAPVLRKSYVRATGRAITRAKRSGLLHLRAKIGDEIADGQHVADICNVFGDVVEEVRVIRGGIAGLVWSHKVVNTGDPVLRCWYTEAAGPFSL